MYGFFLKSRDDCFVMEGNNFRFWVLNIKVSLNIDEMKI